MDNLAQHAVEAAATKVANTAMLGGASASIVFGLTGDEWRAAGVIAGIAIGALGLIAKIVIDIYFRQQHLKLARARIDARLPDGD